MVGYKMCKHCKGKHRTAKAAKACARKKKGPGYWDF